MEAEHRVTSSRRETRCSAPIVNGRSGLFQRHTLNFAFVAFFAVLVDSRLLSCRLSLKLATAAFIASDDVIE